ncbi:ribosomal protein S5 domain 2-type protein [Gongronella butleri]|nr:ribosomal protein S5 domain 2-type protein [Gongronella butleri]
MAPPKHLIILASHDPTSLELNILEQLDVKWMYWHNTPQALLPVAEKPAITWTVESAWFYGLEVTIVANAYNYKQYERWATESHFPADHLLNCGVSSGALGDLGFMQRVTPVTADTLVIASPLLLSKQDVKQLMSCEAPQTVQTGHPCVVAVTSAMLDVLASSQAVVPAENTYDGMTRDLAHWVKESEPNAKETKITLPYEAFLAVENVTAYDRYLESNEFHELRTTHANDIAPVSSGLEPIRVKSYARVGLMGNPSDGFFGCTMSLLIANFWAQVTLVPNASASDASIELLTHRFADGRRFGTAQSLAACCEQDGYDHGDRLLLACIKVFIRYCQENRLAQVDAKTRGFRLGFLTNIPRQVGLAGSSAIVSACWRALMQYHGLDEAHIPLAKQASLVLQVEVDELGIAAGLQDRVSQIYGGLVFMDFNKEYMEANGHGQYTPLPVSLVPDLYLAYIAHPEDSGKVHSTVKKRFLDGDKQVIDAMKNFASYARDARDALQQGAHDKFADLMTCNFEMRRKTYGDAVVGAANLRMVELVRQFGGHAKFCGSGGAIIISLNGCKDDAVHGLQHALEKEGFVFVKLIPQELRSTTQ